MAMAQGRLPFPGDYVWYDSGEAGEFSVPIGAKVKTVTEEWLAFLTEDHEDMSIPISEIHRLKPMNDSNVEGVEDMIHLDDVSEAGLLRNIRIRFGKDRIYTYTGTILVAVNPNKNLGIYNKEMIKRYAGAKLADHPPHIFALANSAYEKMKLTQANQCIINSGETGAGKTESTKLVLQFLAAVSGQHSWIEQQILDSNPVLEAFGNAKTSRNDNSSRFGKYVNIHFDRAGHIQFAKIQQYLLETCRIVQQNTSELNYHVFYLMLNGLQDSERERLHLKGVDAYHYLVQGETPPLPQHNADEFRKVKAAMKVLLFTEEEIWTLFSILAALLHLGNVPFKATEMKQLEASEVADPALARLAADLLKVDEKEMMKWFTNKSTSTGRGDTVVSPLSLDKAMDMRDSFVRGVYRKMFVWVAERINRSIQGQKESEKKFQQRSRSKQKLAADTLSIGILDIFGFEHSDHGNYFEQLCVNYTNEKLQNFFLHHIFRLEQAEYEAEDINWSHIPFIDNQEVLDLLCMRKMNILALVDEESKFPRGSDSTLLQKLTATHGKNALYVKPKPMSDKFGIQHFAGLVSYITEGFLEKNKDTFSKDLIRLLHASDLPLVHSFFKKDFDDMGHKFPPTLAMQFRSSLDDMMEALRGCEPFFVRCIKPNMMMQPTIFDRQLVLKQLRYSGMMETVKIRIVGYPVRMPFASFAKRYWVLYGKGMDSAAQGLDKHSVAKIIKRIKVFDGKDWQVGRTKIFIKEEQFESLEISRAKIVSSMATIIQKRVLLWLTRIRLKRRRAAAVVFQRAWRAARQRRWFLKVRAGFTSLQALWRGYQQLQRYRKIRRAAVGLQPFVRGYIMRRKVDKMVLSLVKLQSHARRLSAKKRVGKLRLELELAREAQRRAEMERREAAEAAARALMDEAQRREEEERIRNLQLQMEAEQKERQEQEMAVQREVEEENRRAEEEKLRVQQEQERLRLEEQRRLEKTREELEKAQEEAKLQQLMDSEELWANSVQKQRNEVADRWREERERMEEIQARQRSSSGTKKTFGLSSPVVKIKRVVSNLALRSSSRARSDSDATKDNSSSEAFFSVGGDVFTPPSLQSLLLPGSSENTGTSGTGQRADDSSSMVGGSKTRSTSKEFGILPYTAAEVEEKPVLVPPTKLSSFAFRKFATVYFRDETRTTFSAHSSVPPLLHHTSVDQRQAASRLRTCVLQFMGDLPDTSNATRAQLIEDVGLIMTKLRHHHKKQETMPLPPYPLSQLDKLHFLVGSCILYPSLRDEVFSILVQQLNGNPTPSSRALGWVLLCCCLGCCTPSERMINYLRSFILTGPKSYAPMLDKRLHRCYQSAGRQWPPSYLEFQAAKRGSAGIPLIVRLPDHRCLTATVDPATTASELCRDIFNGLQLKDTFGFSIAIEMGEQVIDLGASDYPVMDAVSACEQYTAQSKGCDVTTLAANEQHHHQPGQVKQATSALNSCSVMLQRRFFPPWHDSDYDMDCTQMVYHQVVRSIKTGHHHYQSEEELIVLLAQECFVRFNGEDVNTKKLITALSEILPEAELQRRPVRKWSALVKATQAKGGLDLASSTQAEIKRDVVDYAKDVWTQHFSYTYPVERVTGFKIDPSKGPLSLSLHHHGMSLLQDTPSEAPDASDEATARQAKPLAETLLTIPYHQIANIKSNSTSNDTVFTTQVVTMDGDRMYVTSQRSPAICKFVNEILDELRSRSHFAVVVQTPSGDDENWLRVKFGDVIVMDDVYAKIRLSDSDFLGVVNLRTGDSGDLPTACLSVLAVTKEPEREFKHQLTSLNATAHQHLPALVTAAVSSSQLAMTSLPSTRKLSAASSLKPSTTQASLASSSSPLYTLKVYAAKHFAQGGHGAKSIVHPSVWQYTKAELKRPLLFNLRSDSQLSRKALNMFTSILKYCGEYPTRIDLNSPVTTERVFKSPIAHPDLRDELYCQLFKQLTGNPSRASTERLWQLVWLATGLFACSKEFFAEAKLFLRSRAMHTGAAAKCWHRLNAATRGSARQYSPHSREIYAAQHGFGEMTQTVFFPDQSSKQFTISARTKVRNLLEQICQYFGVNRLEFDVVAEQSDSVLSSLPEKQYLLDLLQDAGRDGGEADPRLVFVRQLWIDERLGVNKQLDHRVNFPQEFAKYMQGCHSVTNSQAVYLAVLIWFLKFSHNPSALEDAGFSAVFHQLVPESMVRRMSLKEWRKSIVDEKRKIRTDASVSWAERKFLERLSTVPSFGATFFTMKQTVYSTMPNDVIMAINKHGVALMDATKKNIVARWDYDEISTWSFDSEHFHLTIGGVLRHSSGFRLLCETTEGGMIDMLLNRYTNTTTPTSASAAASGGDDREKRKRLRSDTSTASPQPHRAHHHTEARGLCELQCN